MVDTVTQSVLIPERWNLAELVVDEDLRDLDGLLARIEARVQQFEGWRDRLAPTLNPAEFGELLRLKEAISADLSRAGYFGSLQTYADVRDDAARALAARLDRFGADIRNRVRFFDLWWQDLDDEAAARLMSAAGELDYWLQRLRELKAHTLTAPEERVMTLLEPTGAGAQARLREQIVARYQFTVSAGGRRRIREPEARQLIRSGDPAVRRDAYRAINRRYGADGDVLGEIYHTIVREWSAKQVTLRGYDRPISARNAWNDVPDSAVATLLAVCRDRAGVFQEYFRLKAQLLGLKRLSRYDLYAPVGDDEAHYAYNDAVHLVLDSFERFSPVAAGAARRVFDDRHVDAQVREGKSGGAFCASPGSGLAPYVLLSYAGGSRDVFTLAHELGHAIHAMLAEKHSILTFHSPLPLAETASIFAENLLIDRLIAEASTPEDRIRLLARQIDDAYATVGRQAFFVLFEEAAHDATLGGATVGDLRALYHQNLQQQFGSAVHVPADFAWEWVGIPHFYRSPFYCYAYSFGMLLALALYQRYQSEGATFVPAYFDLLAAGGSVRPADLLRRYGYDLSDAAFWQSGFDYVAGKVAELRELVGATADLSLTIG